MTNDRNAFKLGLTLIFIIALFTGVLMFLAPRGGGDLPLRVRFAHNRLVTSLKAGSEIECGGQTVGSIRKLELQEMPDSSGQRNLYAIVHVKVRSQLGLRRDCKFVPEGPILSGPGRLVILDRGVKEAVQAGDVVEGQFAQDVRGLTRLLAAQLDPSEPGALVTTLRTQLDASDPRSLVAKIHASLSDLNQITDRVRAETDPAQQQALLTRLHGAVDALNKGLTDISTLLDTNRQPINETIQHARNASQILEDQVAVRLAAQLDANAPASLLAKIHVAVDRLETSLHDINGITSDTHDVIVLNREQLNGTIANFKETSEQLKAASHEIRRNPWRLLYQPTQAESSQANVHDAARAFSEAATKLDDAVTRLQSISQSGSPTIDRSQLRDLSDQLQASFDHFSKAESVLWDELKIKR